jgi:SRSO17 transposase
MATREARADQVLAGWPARDDSDGGLVGLARLRWRVEQDYRELKGALGLDHFEGRGFLGWLHHVTLVSVAHGFLTLERLRHPNRWRRRDVVAAAG